MSGSGDTWAGAARLSELQVRRRLRRHLRAALLACGGSQVYLEVFAGSGRWSTAVERRARLGALRVDVLRGPEFDLLNPAVLRVLVGWIGSRVVRGMLVAFPCSSWSQARRGRPGAPGGPLRSSACLWGHPDALARPKDRAKIELGNATLRSAVTLLRAALAAQVPALAENPAGSRAWQTPGMCRLRRHAAAQDVTLDMCQFGARWRKRTRILAVHAPRAAGLRRLCSGRGGLCSSGQPHILLSGCPAGSSVLWTHIAEPYPRPLAEALAAIVVRAADAQELAHSFKLSN